MITNVDGGSFIEEKLSDITATFNDCNNESICAVSKADIDSRAIIDQKLYQVAVAGGCCCVQCSLSSALALSVLKCPILQKKLHYFKLGNPLGDRRTVIKSCHEERSSAL